MKKVTIIFCILMLMVSLNSVAFAENFPQEYMEITVDGDFKIFTKDMQDKELLDAVGKSAADINEILEQTGSESVIINQKTGAQIYLKVKENDTSYDLWNMSNIDNEYLMENIDMIFSDGFFLEGFNYKAEDVRITDYAYMKFILASGSTYQDKSAHGLVCGGSFVNGKAVVFTMVTEGVTPTQEEISAVESIASGVSFTVIKDKTDADITGEEKAETDVFNYILGGFGAIVIIIFCVYMIVRMKNNEQDEEKEEVQNENTEQ